MLLQSVAHRIQKPEEPPSIRGTVIGSGFFVGATLVVALFRCRRDRRNPSAPFGSIEKDSPDLFLLTSFGTSTNHHESPQIKKD